MSFRSGSVRLDTPSSPVRRAAAVLYQAERDIHVLPRGPISFGGRSRLSSTATSPSEKIGIRNGSLDGVPIVQRIERGCFGAVLEMFCAWIRMHQRARLLQVSGQDFKKAPFFLGSVSESQTRIALLLGRRHLSEISGDGDTRKVGVGRLVSPA